MAAYTLAIISYFITGVVISVDKYILSRRAKDPLAFSFYVSLLGLIIFAIWPFDFSYLSLRITIYALIAGASFFPAIYFLNKALVRSEADRVASMIGGISPLIVLGLSYFLLGERLPTSWILAVVFLISGSFILGLENGKVRKTKTKLPILSFLSAVFFALTFFTTKIVFLETSFLNGFSWTRIGTLLVILVIFLFPSARKLIRSSQLRVSKKLFLLFAGNKAVNGFSFFLLNYAIMLGSVSIVNALQGIQYGTIFLLLLIFSYIRPGLVSDQIPFKIIVRKFLGIIFISLGTIFLFLL